METKKIVKISKTSENIKNTIEEMAYGTSAFIALTALEFNMFDYVLNGSFNSFNTHPIGYTATILSPIVIGSLIKTFDPNSETAHDINEMINQIKPKTRKR